ncbi:MAG: hypothetical protein ACOCV8_01760 [Spirochaetota bacterium]
MAAGSLAAGTLAAGLAYKKHRDKKKLYNKYGLKDDKSFNKKFDKDTIKQHTRDAVDDYLAYGLKGDKK